MSTDEFDKFVAEEEALGYSDYDYDEHGEQDWVSGSDGARRSFESADER